MRLKTSFWSIDFSSDPNQMAPPVNVLLKRNYLILDCGQHCDEYVAVQTLSGERSHERWRGFSHSALSGTPVLIPCNGWRNSDSQSWTYLKGGEVLAGVLTQEGVHAYLDGSKPYIVLGDA